MPQIGFHTDAFNSSYWSFEDALKWAQKNDVHFIECGAIDGVSWIHGLGYQPHIALWEDPVALQRKMDDYGVQLSQIDAAFPLSHKEGISLGVRYIINTIRWAHLAGCNFVDTTDDRFAPEGLTDDEALESMKRAYGQVLNVAARFGTTINIEPHGYYTTKPEYMARMLEFFDTPYLRLNMDMGNTFIAGQDPVAFLQQFKDKVTHVHIKDVSESLAAVSRGDLTGIAVSHTAIGDGVNAANIERCVEILIKNGYRGVLSLECEGEGGPMIEKSLTWARALIERVDSRTAVTN
jgi:sugar phosphate isomerase/epimerase